MIAVTFALLFILFFLKCILRLLCLSEHFLKPVGRRLFFVDLQIKRDQYAGILFPAFRCIVILFLLIAFLKKGIQYRDSA